MADDFYGKLTQIMIVFIAEGLRRSHHDGFTGMDAQRIEVLHVADCNTVVKAVTHHFIFHLFPSLERLFDQYLRRERESLLTERNQFLLIVTKTAAEASECICGTHDDRVAQLIGRLDGISRRVDSLALDGLDIDFIKFLDKQFAVLGVHDGTDRSAEHLDIILVKHAALAESHATVEGGLSAESEQDAVRTLLLYDFFNEIWSHGQEINLVSETVGSLHGGDVGIDENGLYTLLLQSLQSLRAGIVKFAGLSNLEGTASKQKHFVKVKSISLRHVSMLCGICSVRWIKM